MPAIGGALGAATDAWNELARPYIDALAPAELGRRGALRDTLDALIIRPGIKPEDVRDVAADAMDRYPRNKRRRSAFILGQFLHRPKSKALEKLFRSVVEFRQLTGKQKGLEAQAAWNAISTAAGPIIALAAPPPAGPIIGGIASAVHGLILAIAVPAAKGDLVAMFQAAEEDAAVTFEELRRIAEEEARSAQPSGTTPPLILPPPGVQIPTPQTLTPKDDAPSDAGGLGFLIPLGAFLLFRRF